LLIWVFLTSFISKLMLFYIIISLHYSIGSDHDGVTAANTCATTGFIMSQYAVSPTLSFQDTFYTFSSCSVNQFYTHLDSMR